MNRIEAITEISGKLHNKMEFKSDVRLVSTQALEIALGDMRRVSAMEMEQLADYGCMGMEREVEE